jgi:hypothetical protein
LSSDGGFIEYHATEVKRQILYFIRYILRRREEKI